MEKINLEWFLKFPGLFITGGILLIFIAAIVYLIASAKEKKAAKADTNFGVDANSMQTETKKEEVVTPLINPTVANVQSENNTVSSPVASVVNTEKKDVSPQASFEPTITPVTPVSIAPSVEEAQPVVTPEAPAVPQNETPVTPIITPVAPVAVTPVVPQESETKIEPAVVETVAPTVESQPVVENKPADIQPVEINVATPSVPEPPAEVKVDTPVAEIKIEPVNIVPVEEKKVESTVTPVSESAVAPQETVQNNTTEAPIEITPQVQEDNIEEI